MASLQVAGAPGPLRHGLTFLLSTHYVRLELKSIPWLSSELSEETSLVGRLTKDLHLGHIVAVLKC